MESGGGTGVGRGRSGGGRKGMRNQYGTPRCCTGNMTSNPSLHPRTHLPPLLRYVSSRKLGPIYRKGERRAKITVTSLVWTIFISLVCLHGRIELSTFSAKEFLIFPPGYKTLVSQLYSMGLSFFASTLECQWSLGRGYWHVARSPCPLFTRIVPRHRNPDDEF